jgi:hypothetical protein
MTAKISHSQLLRVAIAVLFVGGLGIALFKVGRYHTKRHTAPTTETKRMRMPLIQGRVATEADFNAGQAIFYVRGGRSALYSLGHDLPIKAEIVKSDGLDWPIGHQVTIVQAEITDGQHVTLGVIDGDKQAVCALEDVKLLE